MDPIDDRITFSHPQLLSISPHCQVIRVDCRSPGTPKPTSVERVLKFFPSTSRVSYEKEVAIYLKLVRNRVPVNYPSPIGCGDWAFGKYAKVVGKRLQKFGARDDSTISVIMLESIRNTTNLSEMPMVTTSVAAAALKALSRLHEYRIVHGDISTSNVLVLTETDPAAVMWIDFAASWSEASVAQTVWEMERAAVYFANQVQVSKSELLRSAKVEHSADEENEDLPELTEGHDYYDWTFVSEGTHAEIYRVRDVDTNNKYCVKLFRKGWMAPFNLEARAYEALRQAKVERCIPLVYGWDARTLSEWGLPSTDGEEEELYYGLVMEWLEGAEIVSAENLTYSNTCSLLRGLSRIHRAGVLHYDLERRNIMVIPGTERGVWIDFSCSQLHSTYAQPQEMTTAIAILLKAVFPCAIFANLCQLWEAGNRRGARDMIRAYGLYTSNSRKILSLLFSMILLLESAGWIFGRTVLQSRKWGTSVLIEPSFNYAPANIFCAALVATDSSAIHMRNYIFRLAWTVKISYLVFTVSVASAALASGLLSGFSQVWTITRLIATLLWLGKCLEDLLWWRQEHLVPLPGLTFEYDSISETSVSTVDSSSSEASC